MAEPTSFAEPWEARTFALARTLRDSGVVSAAEWTAALSAQVGTDGGEVRYTHWLGALEQLLAAKGLVADADLAQYRSAWAHAARRTPHGEPIDLTPNDFHR